MKISEILAKAKEYPPKTLFRRQKMRNAIIQEHGMAKARKFLEEGGLACSMKWINWLKDWGDKNLNLNGAHKDSQLVEDATADDWYPIHEDIF
jgi:hypothetical protein